MQADLHWIEGPWPGRLAILPRPRGGEWLRDEIASWRQSGLDVVVSLLTQDEVNEFDLGTERHWCEAIGIRFLSFPIADRGVPESRGAAMDLVRTLDKALGEAQCIGVHCRQGIGRSALISACLLVAAGKDPGEAFRHLSAVRGCSVPETPEQREWVRALAPGLPSHVARGG